MQKLVSFFTKGDFHQEYLGLKNTQLEGLKWILNESRSLL